MGDVVFIHGAHTNCSHDDMELFFVDLHEQKKGIVAILNICECQRRIAQYPFFL